MLQKNQLKLGNEKYNRVFVIKRIAVNLYIFFI
jgi:hypothetical protein